MIALARTAMATQQIHQALNAVWAVVAEANRYFAGEAPWALAKTDPTRQATVLYVTAEVVRQIAILAQPVMPEASREDCSTASAFPQGERDFAALGGATRIKPGTVLPAPAGGVSALHRTDSGLNGLSRCLSTAIAISIFRISPTISTASWRGRRPPASGASSRSRRG